MTVERIKEIQKATAYPNSVSVYRALLQVWNECEQSRQAAVSGSLPLPKFLYEDRGGIFIGYHGDTEVSAEWEEWLKENVRQ